MEVGKTYNVTHTRKGSFQMRILNVGSTFVDGIVTAGRANAMCDYNIADVGEKVTVSKEMLRKVTEVENDK